MARAFRCRECGETIAVDTTTGPLPAVCDPCDPERAERRARHRQYNRDGARRRSAQREQQAARIAELEAALRFDQAADERRGQVAARLADADSPRAVVGHAVRVLANADGRAQTIDALLDLAATARAWAQQLAAS